MALGLALGAIVIGRGVVLPALTIIDGLDPNVANAAASVVHLRLSGVVLACVLVFSALVPQVLGTRVGTTAAFVLVAFGSLHRFALLPKLYALRARVDLVVSRPLDRLREADTVAFQEIAVSATMVVIVVALLYATTTRMAAHGSADTASDTRDSTSPRAVVAPGPAQRPT